VSKVKCSSCLGTIYSLGSSLMTIPVSVVIVTKNEEANIASWKKRLAKWWLVDEKLENANCFHTLNTAEYKNIRGCGLNQLVCIVQNGVSIPILILTLLRTKKVRACYINI